MGAMITEDRFGVLTILLNIASVAAATSAEQTFTVRGLKLNDFIAVSKPSLHAGIAVGNARVSAKDTLAIQFINTTAGPIVPGSETWNIFYFRPEHVSSSINI
jgi:hypothetical protein